LHRHFIGLLEAFKAAREARLQANGVLKAIYDVCSKGIVPNAHMTAQLIRPLLDEAKS
jgi:hypothetical protein